MHRLSTANVDIILLVLNNLTGFSTIHSTYPRIHNPQGVGGVDSVRSPAELSTVIHSAAALPAGPDYQKKLYPTYPPRPTLFPHGYPQKSGCPARLVDNLVDNPCITAKNGPQ